MNKRTPVFLTALAVALLSAAPLVLAQSSGGDFAITRSVIAGGGGDSSGGLFRLRGTVGQSVAGDTASGGEFAVRGGFWMSLAERPDPVFTDGFES